MDSEITKLVSLYNLNKEGIQIKYHHDYGTICTLWFISIEYNNIIGNGQSTSKNIALNKATQQLEKNLNKKMYLIKKYFVLKYYIIIR
jgi:hypothetical protein